MSRRVIQQISGFLHHLEQAIFGGQPPAALAAIALSRHYGASNLNQRPAKTLKEIFDNGILWAVPKYRRSIERRLKRKFGTPEYVDKMLKVKTHLRKCIQCGHDHEVGVLCPHCYEKVRLETQQMQDKIQEKLGLQPVDQEVIVLYEDERKQQTNESLQGKRIVEMNKPRPVWFSRNLMQRTTQQADVESKEIKPSELG